MGKSLICSAFPVTLLRKDGCIFFEGSHVFHLVLVLKQVLVSAFRAQFSVKIKNFPKTPKLANARITLSGNTI